MSSLEHSPVALSLEAIVEQTTLPFLNNDKVPEHLISESSGRVKIPNAIFHIGNYLPVRLTIQ
jgi:hypothetical protein